MIYIMGNLVCLTLAIAWVFTSLATLVFSPLQLSCHRFEALFFGLVDNTDCFVSVSFDFTGFI